MKRCCDCKWWAYPSKWFKIIGCNRNNTRSLAEYWVKNASSHKCPYYKRKWWKIGREK